jgi:hypothetical protein
VCVSVRGEALTVMLSPAPQGGDTLLHAASYSGNLKIVEELLARGADVQAKTNVTIARARALCPSCSPTHMLHVYLSCCLTRRRLGCKACA